MLVKKKSNLFHISRAPFCNQSITYQSQIMVRFKESEKRESKWFYTHKTRN